MNSTRRLFLGTTLVVLGGCASSSSRKVAGLPGPIWESPISTDPKHPITFPRSPGGAISRTAWARGRPLPTRMDQMTPIGRITIHHDGMSPFTSTDRSAASRRLESIRRAHLNRRPQPFGDIGYHFAIDPSGRVWECRPVSWQGAHVRGQNQGNLGIVMLGNYDQQGLNAAQKQALVSFVSLQMSRYGIRSGRLATHQELAPTACPGTALQAHMISVRRGPLA